MPKKQKETILILGLGNPEPQYENSPHNAGFSALDKLSEKLGFIFKEDAAYFGVQGRHKGQDMLLIKPKTFMNNSGSVIPKVQKNYKLKSFQLWTVHDDADLPLGTLRVSVNKSAGGHKGVASVIKAFKSQNFVRFRVGTKTSAMPKKKRTNVLSKFVVTPLTGTNKKKLSDAVSKAADAMLLALVKDIASAMSQYNVKK